jgi:hypothetical protein
VPYAEVARVPCAVLQAEVDAAGLTDLDIARVLDWRTADGGLDGQRVRRRLGLERIDSSRGYGTRPQRFVQAATAEAIRAAIRAVEGTEASQ